MTSDTPDQAASEDDLEPSLEELGLVAPPEHAPEPFHDLLTAPEAYEDVLPLLPQRSSAQQSWRVTVSDAKYHWYDLFAGFPERPDIRDPIGRQLRRMQFDLEATMEKRLIYFVINRPIVRFDTTRNTSWAFFSLKLTVPILIGTEGKRGSVQMELVVPFAATLKKPVVTMTDRFITLNWGGLVEALSIHDVLQQYDHDLKVPSKVQYVGQTKDPAGRLARARLSAVQRIHFNNSEHHDLLLLVLRMQVEVVCDDGDPADKPVNQNAVAADMLLKDRVDAIECALIRYFEGPIMQGRTSREVEVRRERMLEIEASNHLQHMHIDLRIADGNPYNDLYSAAAPASSAHIVDCSFKEGAVLTTPAPPPVAPAAGKARA
ncbi:hypothetical protein ASF61_18645 [Duganella sp. Leaf126]|uniref:hypothetical protein n=1 Tax=Duganella sp. Leaf126 TaxID=1736266 RepID=UPI0006F81A64|nr:hypothetical protein [Duganella sp. Leaf126]KQQ46410.1 hypothetical protein ASF61_18645 [Duganella sp. Leaf126]